MWEQLRASNLIVEGGNRRSSISMGAEYSIQMHVPENEDLGDAAGLHCRWWLDVLAMLD